MVRVKTFNKISNSGLDILRKNLFEVSEDVSSPDAILVRSYNLNDFDIKSHESLKAVGRAGAGVNNIPVDQCTENGVVVFNTPGANANAVKELVLTALLLSTRDIIGGIQFAKSLKGKGPDISGVVESNKSSFKGTELKGKKIGVIGLGAIGVMVANAAVALGMDVLGHDPFITVDRAWGLSRSVRQSQDLNHFLGECDFLTMHMPLTDSTRKFFNKERLKKLKKSVIILNFSRPEIVDEDGIVEALNEDTIAKYVCDFPSELTLSHNNVIAIPHLGASTHEAEENCAVMISEQVLDFFKNGNIINSVNFPDCSMERSGDHRISIINKNIPNMVGQISKVLADSGLNIVEMLNKSRGDYAYTLVDIMGDLTQPVVDKLSQIEGVISARWIK